MNKKKEIPSGPYRVGDTILCINDDKNNPDIPELQSGKRYVVVEVSDHGRPRVVGINEEGEEELCFYNPNRFRKILTDEEIAHQTREGMRVMEENMRKRDAAMLKKIR